MREACDVAIVGAGAAGLAAAIFAGEAAARRRGATRPRIIALDGARALGVKILSSGGGRCNITNQEVGPEDYNGSRNVVRNVLRAFDQHAAIRWFASLGVEVRPEPSGKLFPVTDKARTVLDALTRRCRDLGVNLRMGHKVLDVLPLEQGGPGLVIRHEHGELEALRVVMATGGRSMPSSGSDGSGFGIVRRLGHTVATPFPALVPLVLEKGFFHASLSGASQQVELALFADGRLAERRAGELLWTHFGASGPVVLDMSRHWLKARLDGARPELRASFLPGEDPKQVEKWLIEQARAFPRRLVVTVLASRLPHGTAEALARHCGIDPALRLSQLRAEDRGKLVRALTGLSLPVSGDRGWDHAEATAGGVPLNEIDWRTMASRKAPGLYLAGEMLDCDGRIGGFNFQWAWSTGYLAGRASATGLPESSGA